MKRPVSIVSACILVSAIASTTLFGCKEAEKWTLIADFQDGKMFVQEASISAQDGLVTARFRQEYARPLRTEFLSVEHWAINQEVRISCSEDSWTTLWAVAFDKNNNVLKDETYDGTTYFAIHKNAAIHKVTTMVCEHALHGSRLVVQS